MMMMPNNTTGGSMMLTPVRTTFDSHRHQSSAALSPSSAAKTTRMTGVCLLLMLFVAGPLCAANVFRQENTPEKRRSEDIDAFVSTLVDMDGGVQAPIFSREDRGADYRPLQFGKRQDQSYRPLQFGKRQSAALYRPLQFGKRSGAWHWPTSKHPIGDLEAAYRLVASAAAN